MCDSRLGLAWLCATVIAVTGLSCDGRQSSTGERQPDTSIDAGPAVDNSESSKTAPKADDDPLTLSGESGEVLLADGLVRNPDGSACPGATVTLEWDVNRQIRFLTVTSDETGSFAIYGPSLPCWSHPLWAATDDGKLGNTWIHRRIHKNETIKLYGGQTTLYVRDKQCDPVPNALVDVCVGGVSDMAEAVPPNIRKMLLRRTGEDGTARWPSTLSGRDLGFEVTAAGYGVQRDADYMGMPGGKRYYGAHPEGFYSPIKVFVLDGDHLDRQACAKMIEAELESRE